ncbi:phospholipid N-methyltransferase [Bradyrhizobium sp. i1.7.7]
MPNDFLSFFLSWMSAPRRVGAIAPSGAALADLITREITATTGPILELGPGTGAFTYKLLKRGVRQQDLTLIEYGSDFTKLLQIRFPGARVLWMDAGRLTTERLYDGAPVGAVVSGLPLLNMSTRKVVSIIGGACVSLRPPGRRVLSVHLRDELPGAAAGARPARLAGKAGGSRLAERAAGRRLQADATAADEDRHGNACA